MLVETPLYMRVEMREARPNFSAATKPIQLEQPRTYHLPNWDGFKDPKKLQIMREIVLQYGRDPRVAQLAVEICRQAGCKPREYQRQAECLLKWVQTQVYYVNEAGERLQSPLYTLKTRMGDCDDMAMLLCSFFEALRLPWKFVISANTRNGLVRYCEGDKNFQPLPYSHIYCAVGDRPFTPQRWIYCEPTMDVPLGWDIVATQSDPEARKYLPELGGVASSIVGSTVGGAVGEAAGEASVTRNVAKFAKQVAVAIVAGSLTAVGTEILLDYLRASALYKKLVLKKNKRSK